MAFCFKRKESATKAIRRICHERIATALESLKHCHQANAIHCVRKDIKKVRAALRLVRDGIPPKTFRRLMRMLRESANDLSPTRDAYVKLKALRNLAQHFKRELHFGPVRRIRKTLQGDFQQATWTFAKEKTAGQVERILKRIAANLDELPVCRKGWRALSTGLKTNYRQGLNAYHIALKDPSTENLHEWRKRIKDLWYQIRLLRPVWPEQMDAAADELKTLSEYLGDDHDLVMLEKAASECCQKDGKVEEWEVLRDLIKQRQDELRKAAFKLGARLYAEKPSAFGKRLGKYWQIWRSRKNKRSLRVLEALT